MSAPIGNTNAVKAKIWSDAIRKAVMRTVEGDPENKKKIDALAERIVSAGLDGDMAALKEIGDRLEGKAAQSVTLLGDEDNPVQVVTRIELVAMRKNDSGAD